VKAAKANIGRAVDQPNPAVRFYLFYGPDQAQSRALGQRLLDSLGATKFAIAAGDIAADPAALADEAGAISLFGDKRALWIEPASDDIAPAAEALLAAPAVESPAIAIAGGLRKTSALVKLAEASPAALAFAAYLPEGRDSERMVIDVGRTLGLKIAPPIAARIAEACAADQALVTRELEKLALYAGASVEAPKELDHEAVDAVGAALPEGDFLRLADLALAGDIGALSEELAHLSAAGTEAIPAVRALQRRLLMLAPARARVDRGERVDAVMASFGKSLFWRDKDLVGKLLQKWDSAALATIAERAGKLERTLMLSDAPESGALGEELVAIARKARSRA
jgi:DNA polymerase-3 subunit delta